LQHVQDAVKCSFITDGALAATSFTRWDEGWDEWFELFPQLFTDGGARHTAAKHKRFAALQRKVALAALSPPSGAATAAARLYSRRQLCAQVTQAPPGTPPNSWCMTPWRWSCGPWASSSERGHQKPKTKLRLDKGHDWHAHDYKPREPPHAAVFSLRRNA